MDTLPNVTGGLFALAGGLAFFTGLALFRAISAARWHNQRQFWQFLALSIPLAIGTAGVFWIGHQKWYLSAFGDMGFSPDWQCTTNPLTEPVCLRNVPKPRAPQPKAGGESR